MRIGLIFAVLLALTVFVSLAEAATGGPLGASAANTHTPHSSLQPRLTPLAPPQRHVERGPASGVRCVVKTHDIGTIVGRGKSPDDAFEDAATQCFERRRALFRLKRGGEVDMETGELYIDICANISCES